MDSLLNPRTWRQLQLVGREAKRQGVAIAELDNEAVARALYCRVDPRSLGLPADEDITAEPFLDRPELVEADTGLRTGDWESAARLLAGHGHEWDRRGADINILADTCADHGAALERWTTTRPTDPHALVLRAETLVKRAWNVRGGRRAAETSDEQFAGFFRLLDEAEAAALAAIEAAPDDPTPWASLVTLGRGQQFSVQRFQRTFDELLARAPYHRHGHDQALQYWCEKWGGSHERMFAFADEAAAKAPTLTPLPLAAYLEYSIKQKRPRPTRYARRALEATLEWLAAEGATTPYAQHDHGLAATILVETKRYDEAVERFRAQGTHADAWVWSYSDDARLHFLQARWRACNRARNARR